MTKQYYVSYVCMDGGQLLYGCDIPFATGPVTFRIVVQWRDDIQRLKHPGSKIVILSWQELA